ncbi:carbohydrate ABC transporter permease [Cellulosilyticum sp. I15G10I2]|uniref:carbohydrate ABC transporter permease n=1 Tax=Cellulosilyticum sp. I15G10I2 TaxID=1892843 RepID=UPI00085BC82B|nr:sugar ABC transporter permease [Cellulosilyticum sp. I15G10I2]
MNTKKIYPWYFAAAAIIIYFVLCFLPGLLGLFYSLTDWNAYSSKINYVGFRNYLDIFKDSSQYRTFIWNTLVFTVVTTVLKTATGLSMALVLTNKRIRLCNFHRLVIFSPQVMSYLVVGLVFKSLLHPSNGFVNNFLKDIGMEFMAKSWLTDLSLAFGTVMTVDTWKGAGYIMVIIIAALQAISPTYYEAASIDGASYLDKFRYITLPLLKPILVSATVLNVTYGLRVFDMVYALTNGGPGNATGVINTAVYKEFSKGNYAMGTTLSSVLFVIVLGLLYFIVKSMESKEVDA